MLRESSKIIDLEANITELVQIGKISEDDDYIIASILSDFAEAVVYRDRKMVTQLRSQIILELGEEAFVDAAATAAAFHGFVRVADSTGIPHSTAGGGQDSSALQREVGIDKFYAANLGDRG